VVTMSEQRPWDLEREILDLIADKWAMLIVNCLGQGTLRFTQLKAEVAGISHKMLAQTLRGLERNGIVERHPYATVPPRVDYDLTPPGEELLRVAIQICAWTRRNREDIEKARIAFDLARG
jgi:DNA-binding HxlR family transcriptional regulator